jgi:hypothetical protein
MALCILVSWKSDTMRKPSFPFLFYYPFVMVHLTLDNDQIHKYNLTETFYSNKYDLIVAFHVNKIMGVKNKNHYIIVLPFV